MINTHFLALIIALVIEAVNGEVREKVCPIHPVVITWKLGNFLLHKVRKDVPGGIALWFLTVIPVLGAYAVIPEILLRVFNNNIILTLILVVAYASLLKFSFSIKLLRWYYTNILNYLTAGNEARARVLLQEIVRRDVFSLTYDEVLSALVETYVESIVDGIAGPFFYYIFMGIVGSYLQRLANTMDSLVGYTYEPYQKVGKFSAYVDTVLNLPAALLTTFLIIILTRCNIKKFLKVLKNAKSVKSINARLVFSAIAAGYDIVLVKPGDYAVNYGGRRLSIDICRRVLRTCDYVVLMLVVITLVLSLLLRV